MPKFSKHPRTAGIFLLTLRHVAYANNGFHNFISRPDIKAPIWDVVVYPRDDGQELGLAPGNWFVAPYRGHDSQDFAPDSGWIGPHIYNQDGSLIWSDAPLVDTDDGIGAVEAFTLSSVDFGEGAGEEQTLTAMDMRFSKAVFIDNHYKIRRKEEASGPGAYNTHELNFVNNGTKALVVWTHVRHESTEEESALVGFEGRCHSMCNGIVEYDVKTWETTFVWSSCPDEHGKGFIDLTESTMNNKEAMDARCEGHWDYVHANSADKTPEGDYLMSSRHADALYKISHVDGSIIWRLGGTKSDFVHLDDFKFSRQHHVRYRGGNSTHTIISILDNARGQEGWKGASYPFSRGLFIALDEASTPMTAQVVAQYNHPDGPGHWAPRRGGCQLLPNGNVFMGWSEQALMSEHAPDGTILMSARLQAEWTGSYRAFKFDGWVGLPQDPPDVVARAVISDNPEIGPTTEVFVSWNGATEVTLWKVYHSTASGKKKELLNAAQKLSFETHLTHNSFTSDYPSHIIVEALARNNTVLATSRVTEVLLVNQADYQDLFEKDPSIFTNPIFIASFAATVTLVIVVLLGLWLWRMRHRRALKGKALSPQYEDGDGVGYSTRRLTLTQLVRKLLGLLRRGKPPQHGSGEDDTAGIEGHEPLMEAKDWNERENLDVNRNEASKSDESLAVG